MVGGVFIALGGAYGYSVPFGVLSPHVPWGYAVFMLHLAVLFVGGWSRSNFLSALESMALFCCDFNLNASATSSALLIIAGLVMCKLKD